MQSNAKELAKKYQQGSISRREFLRLSGLLGLSLSGAGSHAGGLRPCRHACACSAHRWYPQQCHPQHRRRN